MLGEPLKRGAEKRFRTLNQLILTAFTHFHGSERSYGEVDQTRHHRLRNARG